jgi:hypothetical protein
MPCSLLSKPPILGLPTPYRNVNHSSTFQDCVLYNLAKEMPQESSVACHTFHTEVGVVKNDVTEG